MDAPVGSMQKAFLSDPSVRAILRTKDPRFREFDPPDGIEQARLTAVIVMDRATPHARSCRNTGLLHVGKIYDIVSASRSGRWADGRHIALSDQHAYNWMLRLVLRTQVRNNLGGYFTARRNAPPVVGRHDFLRLWGLLFPAFAFRAARWDVDSRDPSQVPGERDGQEQVQLVAHDPNIYDGGISSAFAYLAKATAEAQARYSGQRAWASARLAVSTPIAVSPEG